MGSPLRTSPRNSLAPAALIVLAAGVLVVLASRIRNWAVMTDEMLYAKLATHIGRTLSPVPTIRGTHLHVYSLLYPLLLSPLYRWLPSVDAFRAAHVLNALLFASAAVPVYLLGREARLSPEWAGIVALLSIVVPWNTLTAFVMTESVAYPAFLWAMLAVLRAVAAPSPTRDVVAVIAIAIAVLARTQFVALGAAFVLAALIYDRRRHVVLAVVTIAAVVVAVVGGSRLLGNYSVTASKWPLPLSAFTYAGAHIDEIGIAVALVPLLLGGAWLIAHARRDPFALLALITVVILTLETSSFDVRFGGSIVRDRYLFYVAPLLLLAMARALSAVEIPRLTLLIVTWFVAVTGFVYGYPLIPGYWQDSPAGVLHALIQHLRGPGFVAVVATVLTILILRLSSRPRVLAVGAVAFVFVTAAASSGVAWSRIVTGRGPGGHKLATAPDRPDWIDATVPANARVAMVPYALSTHWLGNAARWWGTEFWNKAVQSVYTDGSQWDYTPFPTQGLAIDPRNGVVAGTRDAAPYVVVERSDARLRLAGPRVATSHGLDLIRAKRPYRALWLSNGLDPDGWTRPGRPASIRAFGEGKAAVLFRDARGRTRTKCGHGKISLPGGKTGVIRAAPIDPTTKGNRAVGVRVLRVRILASCLHSAA